MSQVASRRGSWLVTLPLLALTLLFLFAVYLPGRSTRKTLLAELEEHQQAIAQAQPVPAQIQHAQRQLEHCQQYVGEWRQRLPRRAGASALFAAIGRVAEQAGAEATRFEPGTVRDMELLQQLPVSIECSGSFDEMYRLLGGLEQLPHFVWLEDVQFRRGPSSGGELKGELELVVFADRTANSD